MSTSTTSERRQEVRPMADVEDLRDVVEEVTGERPDDGEHEVEEYRGPGLGRVPWWDREA